MSLAGNARILVFRVGELGDTIIALPSLKAVRRAFPKAHITFLGNVDSSSRYVTPRQILPTGLINDWLSYTSEPPNLWPWKSIRLLKRLHELRFDTLVYLAPRLRRPSEIRRDLLFFRLAGIKNTIGQHGFEPLPRNPNTALPVVEHEADHLLRRLSLSEIPVPRPGEADLNLELSADENKTAHGWLAKHTPFGNGERLIGFGPGSKWPSKVWPEERFAELGRRLIQKLDVYPVLFGGSEDRGLADRLIAHWGKGLSAAGVLSPRQAAAALSRCALYVGNDTGTMHLAAAVQTPCVAIMAALDWPGHWSPYGEGHVVLRRAVPCEGCLLRVCEHERMRCLKAIEVEEVMDACSQVLSRRGKHPEEGAAQRKSETIENGDALVSHQRVSV